MSFLHLLSQHSACEPTQRAVICSDLNNKLRSKKEKAKGTEGMEFIIYHFICQRKAYGKYFIKTFIVVPCMLFQSLLYCFNLCTSLHFKILNSHTKTLKIRTYMFRSPLKPSSGGPWPYFARLLNWNVDLHLL